MNTMTIAVRETPFNTTAEKHASIDFNIQRERYLLLLSAGMTSSFTCSVYNSLDCFRVRWQVRPASLHSDGMVKFAKQIISTEGFVNGLWRPGLAANAMAMGSSTALRFGYYESMRDALNGISRSSDQKSGASMIVAGTLTGAVAYSVTTPFHLLKTMIQAERGQIGPDGRYLSGSRVGKYPYATGFYTGARNIVADNGISGLWKGCGPLAARGALFSGGQMLGYDGFKTFCKSNGVEDGPLLQFVSAAVASVGATFFSTPADIIMSRYMASSSENTTSFHIIRQLYRESGIVTFWRGGTVNLYRTTPAMLTYTAIYEQIRLHMGLGYFS